MQGENKNNFIILHGGLAKRKKKGRKVMGLALALAMVGVGLIFIKMPVGICLGLMALITLVKGMNILNIQTKNKSEFNLLQEEQADCEYKRVDLVNSYKIANIYDNKRERV